MGRKNKNNSFSFENDPGKLTGDDDATFTFTDIPVLGTDKNKDLFFFEELPDTEPDPSLASFEALLTEQPDSESNIEEPPDFDSTATTIDVKRTITGKNIKRKKKIIIISSVAAATIILLLIVSSVISSSPPPEEEKKPKILTPAEKAAIAKRKRKKRIASMIKDADSQLNMDDPQKALELFQKVLKIEQTSPAAYTGIGRCYEKLNETQKAEESYEKAINFKPTTPDPYIFLARILIGKNDSPQALEIMQKAQTKFPENPKVASTLGEIYYQKGDFEQALTAYRLIKRKSDFSKEALKHFGILLQDDSPKEAEQLYMFAGKKFKSSDFFILAADTTESPSNKITILNKALKIIPEDDKNIDEVKFMLAEAYINDDNKYEASETLKQIDLTKLDKKQCSNLIPLATASGIEDIKSYCLKLLESNSNEIALQEAILKELEKTQSPEKLLGIYSSWWTAHTNEPVPNYLYALTLGDSPAAKKYFSTAIALNPKFYEAIVELAKIEIKTNNSAAAIRNLKKAIALKKYDILPRKLLAIAKIKQGHEKDAIEEYARFINSRELKQSEKALLLLEPAMMMKTSIYANKYLAELKKDPAMLQEYRENNVKKKLIFGGASSSDFRGQKTGLMRKYYILFLLSQGRLDTLMRLHTSKEEFPEFWKIYLMRKKGMKTWLPLAKLYYEKNSKTGSPAILLTISMWLGNTTIEDAEKQINRISQEKRGILYALIAEEYVRKKKMTKAIIRFKKAIRAPKSIYNGVIRYIYNSLRKQR
jgi:tetratricopeptide (TPR) repeat protein